MPCNLTDLLDRGPRLEVARFYVSCGLSVIPVKTDGTKSPKLNGWRAYSRRLPTDDELVEWFSVPAGIGVVPGPASGNLVVLDFESKLSRPAYPEWLAKLSPALASVVPTFPIVRTPSGGRHLWIRLPDAEAGGRICRYANGATKIEVRGEGHQVLAPGCPPECHPSNTTYVFESLGWLS